MDREPLDSVRLLDGCRAGDSAAADELFHRYLTRLTRLARTRLAPRLAQRTDPEDVVLSAYRSFFVAAQAGRFTIRRSGDLWRLLVEITLHKLARAARRHSAARRDARRESAWDETAVAAHLADPRGPSPEEAVGVADELGQVMSELDPLPRRMLELRLQGEDVAAIATETERSERTVRRILKEIGERLATRFDRIADD